MRIQRLAATTGLAALALSGVGLGQGSAPTYAKLGTVNVMETLDGSEVSRMASGFFIAPAQPLNAVPGLTTAARGICFVTALTPGQAPPPGQGPGGAGLNALDAGERLTIRGGGHDLATIERMAMDSGQIKSINYIAADLPELKGDLLLDIPGATPGFPKMTGVAFPAMPPAMDLQASTPLSAITKATTFSWTAGSSGNLVILGGDGKAGGKDANFTCTAADDGRFAFPADTQAEMDKIGFTDGHLTNAGRIADSSHVVGDAVLVISVNRMTLYGK